jgi:hypothetical protein
MAISFFGGWYLNGLRLNAEIAQLHATWNEAYANQAKLTVDKDNELNLLNTQIEVTNAAKEKAISDAHDENIRLASDIERLQHTTSASGSSLPKASNSCKCASAATTSEFSDASISFLIQLAREADEAARYASNCHDWAVGTVNELSK